MTQLMLNQWIRLCPTLKSLSRHNVCKGFSSSSSSMAKSMSEMPQMGLMDMIGIARASKKKQMHLGFESAAQKYGPMVRFRMGPKKVVLCSSPSAVESMFRQDEQHPRRITPAPLDLLKEQILEQTGEPFVKGVALADGMEWQRQRSAIQKAFLRPRQLAVYTDLIDRIAAKTTQELGRLRTEPDKAFPGFSLNEALSKWSFEGAFAILTNQFVESAGLPPNFHLRMGNILSRNLHIMERLAFIPPKFAQRWNLKIWRDYTNNTMGMYREFKEVIKKVHEDVGEKGSDDKNFIQQMYDEGLSEPEIVSSSLDVLIASLDTTARTAGFALHLLASDPDFQERLRDEALSNADATNIPLISAFLKEVLRLYPVSPILSRCFSKDIVLDDFVIPQEVYIIVSVWNMSRSAQLFPDPLRLDVSRWLRQPEQKHLVDPFSYVPFGFGKRGCVGKRLSELELTLLLKHILSNYRLELTNKKPLEIEMRMALANAEPLPVRFTDL